MSLITSLLQPLTAEDKITLNAAANARINTWVGVHDDITSVNQIRFEGYVMIAIVSRLSAVGATFYRVNLSYRHASGLLIGYTYNRIITRVEDAVELVHRNVCRINCERVCDPEDMMAALEPANFIQDMEVTREPGSQFACLHMRDSPHWLDVTVFNGEYCVFLPPTPTRAAQVYENIGAKQTDLNQKARDVFAFWLASRR